MTITDASYITGYFRNNGLSTWTDLSGEGNNGTPTSLTETILIPQGVDGSRDAQGFIMNKARNTSCLNLDTIGYVQVSDDSALDFGTGDFSLEVWVKADYLNQGDAYNTILSLGDNVINTDNAAIVSLSNSFRFLCGGNAADKWIQTGSYTQNAWTHLVAVRDSGTTKFYMNTTSQSGGESNATNITNNDAVLIGRDLDTDRFYPNSIDGVRFYNRALSLEEVKRNYKATKGSHRN
jgi:hypothetical protein